MEIAGARPVFSFLILAYAAFHWESRRILPLAAFLGLARDILGGGVWGVEMLMLTCAGYLLDSIAHKIEREFPGIYFLLTVMFCFFILMGEMLIDGVLGKAAPITNEHLRIILVSSFYTALFLPFFYQIADFLFKPHSELRQYDFFQA
jgi:rod shape-determining protein MreD